MGGIDGTGTGPPGWAGARGRRCPGRQSSSGNRELTTIARLLNFIAQASLVALVLLLVLWVGSGGCGSHLNAGPLSARVAGWSLHVSWDGGGGGAAGTGAGTGAGGGGEFVCPLAALVVAAAVLPAAVLIPQWLRDWQRHRRLGAGRCANCGYDLRGGSARCPECSWPSDPGPTPPDSSAPPPDA